MRRRWWYWGGYARRFRAVFSCSAAKYLGQAEFRNAIPQHAADLIFRLKNRDVVAHFGEQNGGRNTRRAGADHRDHPPVFRRARNRHLVKVGIGNIIFNAAEMNRHAFAPQHTVAFTLFFMITHQRADDGQRVILKKHFPGGLQSLIQKRADHLGDGRMNRAPFLTHRLFTI